MGSACSRHPGCTYELSVWLAGGARGSVEEPHRAQLIEEPPLADARRRQRAALLRHRCRRSEVLDGKMRGLMPQVQLEPQTQQDASWCDAQAHASCMYAVISRRAHRRAAPHCACTHARCPICLMIHIHVRRPIARVCTRIAPCLMLHAQRAVSRFMPHAHTCGASCLMHTCAVQGMVEGRGHAFGLAATPALLAVEESLDVQALSAVRALRQQAHAGVCLG